MNTAVLSARKDLGLTQKRAARRCRMNHAFLGLIEQGWVPPKSVRERVAKQFGATDAELFSDAIKRLAT